MNNSRSDGRKVSVERAISPSNQGVESTCVSPWIHAPTAPSTAT